MSTPDSQHWRRRHDVGFLVKNCRGLMFAAFASTSQIAQLLGTDEKGAQRFQAEARDTFHTLRLEVRAEHERSRVKPL